MQKNWIGKSFGCEIEFKIEVIKKKLKKLNVLQQDQILYLDVFFSTFS
jgi:leucyl-tRNA synthetase